MDVKLINPFINATLNVLETMAFIKPEAGKPYLKKNGFAQGDISGVIGFTGAIPSVITGKNHKLIPMAKGRKIAIPFKTDSGSFTIEVALEG